MKTILAALVAASTIACAIQAVASEPALVPSDVDRSVTVRSDVANRIERAHDDAASRKVRVVLASPYGD